MFVQTESGAQDRSVLGGVLSVLSIVLVNNADHLNSTYLTLSLYTRFIFTTKMIAV